MLVGETPGFWPTEEAVRLGRFVDATPEHRERLDALPGRVEQTLVKALAVRPADRFSTPGEFVQALVTASESSRRFSDSELQAIIGRAAELQAQNRTEESALSLGGVEQVAAEVGIPPERVREAVKELDDRSRQAATRRPRPPSRDDVPERLWVERAVEREVVESDYVAIVDEIRRTIGDAGHVKLFFSGSLAWSTGASRDVGRDIQVTITPQAGRTLIRIEETLSLPGGQLMAPILGTAGGGILGILISLGLGVSGWVMIPAGLLGFWGGSLTASSILRRNAEHRTPQLERLADRLAVLAKGAASVQGL